MNLKHSFVIPLLTAALSVAPLTRVLAQNNANVPATDAAWPASAKVLWGNELVQVQSAKRARISLNGPWKFSPGQSLSGEANAAPEKGWGSSAGIVASASHARPD